MMGLDEWILWKETANLSPLRLENIRITHYRRNFNQTLFFENGWNSAGKDAEIDVAIVPPVNNTIQKQIKDIIVEIKSQVGQEFKTVPFGLCAIQLDKLGVISLRTRFNGAL